jgi:hypothetical protein
MSNKWVVVFITIILTVVGTVAMAGGPAYSVPQTTQGAPCGPNVGGPQSNYWGDAPIPGLCGGVIALPFLVVGSLLGGNPAGPYGPAPYGPAPYGPPTQACPPGSYAPPACPPGAPQYGGPPPGYGYAPPAGPLSGIPCLDMFSSFFGGQG